MSGGLIYCPLRGMEHLRSLVCLVISKWDYAGKLPGPFDLTGLLLVGSRIKHEIHLWAGSV